MNHMRNIIVLLLVMPAFLLSVPKRIVIIRHGEQLEQKDPGPYLAPCGMQRSLQLPHYFAKTFPVPAALFAQGIKHASSSLRPIQTMAPTATHFASLFPEKAKTFTLQTQFLPKQEKELAQFILNEESYNDTTIIICWAHQYIKNLATYLGVENPPHWPHKVYDWVWIVTYDQLTKKIKSFEVETQPFIVVC